MIKFGTRVRNISPNCCTAALGETGTIIDTDSYDRIIGCYRYLVRWDNNPTMIWGVYSDMIEVIL